GPFRIDTSGNAADQASLYFADDPRAPFWLLVPTFNLPPRFFATPPNSSPRPVALGPTASPSSSASSSPSASPAPTATAGPTPTPGTTPTPTPTPNPTPTPTPSPTPTPTATPTPSPTPSVTPTITVSVSPSSVVEGNDATFTVSSSVVVSKLVT